MLIRHFFRSTSPPFFFDASLKFSWFGIGYSILYRFIFDAECRIS
jgi:hypothetical protein